MHSADQVEHERPSTYPVQIDLVDRKMVYTQLQKHLP